MSLDFLLETNKTKPKDGYALLDISQLAIATAVNTFSDASFEKFSLNLMRHLILSTLKSNVVRCRNEGYPNIVICADNTHTEGYWRREIASYYKRNRAKIKENSKFDFEGFFEFFPQVLQEICDNMPYIVMYIPKLEADDHIGVICKWCAIRNIPVRIVSSDGDFTQLQKYENVTQWSPMQKKLVKPKNGSAHLDLIYKIVKGDKKDGIASIKCRSDYIISKIEGERAAACATKWIEQIADCETDEQIEAIINDSEQFKRFKENRVLIDLTYVPDHFQELIIETFTTTKPAPINKMRKYFIQAGLVKLLKEIEKF